MCVCVCAVRCMLCAVCCMLCDQLLRLLFHAGISSCNPEEYARRFERRVAAQIIESYDKHTPESPVTPVLTRRK